MEILLKPEGFWNVIKTILTKERTRKSKFGNRTIGMNHPTYFIADIAANHDGDWSGKAPHSSGKEAGADAAKFQNFDAPKIVSDYGFTHMNAQVSHQATWKKSVAEVYRAASIPFEWTTTLMEECMKLVLITSRHHMILPPLIFLIIREVYKLALANRLDRSLERMASRGKRCSCDRRLDDW